jgi:phage terminase large subunit
LFIEKTEIKILQINISADPFEEYIKQEEGREKRKREETLKHHSQTEDDNKPWLDFSPATGSIGKVGKYLAKTPEKVSFVPNQS